MNQSKPTSKYLNKFCFSESGTLVWSF